MAGNCDKKIIKLSSISTTARFHRRIGQMNKLYIASSILIRKLEFVFDYRPINYLNSIQIITKLLSVV